MLDDEVELLGGSVGVDLDHALVPWRRTLVGRASRPCILSM